LPVSRGGSLNIGSTTEYWQIRAIKRKPSTTLRRLTWWLLLLLTKKENECMNEVIINTKEIESIWEKDHLCFIKMKSGKVWICDECQTIGTGVKTWSVRTVEKVTRNVANNGLTIIQLSQKGKSDRYGKK
jgi:hypothetical protein